MDMYRIVLKVHTNMPALVASIAMEQEAHVNVALHLVTVAICTHVQTNMC